MAHISGAVPFVSVIGPMQGLDTVTHYMGTETSGRNGY